jgi:hypothetical protein
LPPKDDENYRTTLSEIIARRRSALASMKLANANADNSTQLDDDQESARRLCLAELAADVVALQLLLNTGIVFDISL